MGSSWLGILNELTASNFSVQSIHLFNCGVNPISSDRNIPYKFKFFSLREIFFDYNFDCTKSYHDFFNGISHSFSSLCKLNFSNYKLIPLGKNLGYFFRLIKINLSKTNIDLDEKISGLISSKSTLQQISLTNCDLINFESLKFHEILLSFTNIKEIDLSESKISKKMFKNIFKGLKNSSAMLQRINMSGMKQLYFCDPNDDDSEINQILSQYHYLEEIIFRDTYIVYICTIMKGLLKSKRTLKKIDFSSCNLSPVYVKGIDTILREFSSLEEINFENNVKLGIGVGHILKGLVNSGNTLKKINFLGCNAELIKEISIKFPILQVIQIGFNKKSITYLENIIKLLKQSNSTLEKLHFYH